MKRLAIILISLVTALTSFVPAQAFPVRPVTSSASSTGAGSTDAQQVQYREERRIIRRHNQRNGHRYSGRYDRRDRYSDHRRYDRRHRNNGAIIGGLAAGAIIGGAIASQNRSSCAARYRSYRASDNTYQPNSGPRRVCR
ncbi:BA14K family protein [Rhizobium sp. NFR03]|uniref:BA14K family protein n=1 Tax=Rhizobium sp. NFR03 TaxID=1566263 RepID=UPI0008B5F6C4|nr:BA14K family protein [Rhizobium sp. NFR03]SES39124.1 BA14K-like protein [Rhizobium sp. NFR03]